MEFIYKSCVFLHAYTSVTFKVLSIWYNTPIKTFFPRLKPVFGVVSFDAFLCFCYFLFHLFHFDKMFLFEDFSHPGNKKVALVRPGEYGRRGTGVMPFLVRNC